MNIITKVLLIGLAAINFGCDKRSDCGVCFTPPSPFLFEIVDKATDENLFTNGTYESKQIEIINADDNKNVNYKFIGENDFNVIQINSIGWKTEKINIMVKISNINIFNFHVDAERLTQDCCSFTKYNEIRIDNSEFELDTEYGVYKIVVE